METIKISTFQVINYFLTGFVIVFASYLSLSPHNYCYDTITNIGRALTKGQFVLGFLFSSLAGIIINAFRNTFIEYFLFEHVYKEENTETGLPGRINWNFFHTANKEKLEQLESSYYVFYSGSLNLSIALSISAQILWKGDYFQSCTVILIIYLCAIILLSYGLWPLRRQMIRATWERKEKGANLSCYCSRKKLRCYCWVKGITVCLIIGLPFLIRCLPSFPTKTDNCGSQKELDTTELSKAGASIITFSASTPALLPTKIDLSVYCPSNRFQYDATCYAYAFAYTALSINFCVKNNINDRASVENNAFSSGFISSMHRKRSRFNPNCGRNGSYDVDLEIVKEYGCPKLKDFDINCTKSIPQTVMDLAKKEVKLKDYKYIQEANDNSEASIQAIKDVLARKVPVLIVLKMTDDFAELGRDCNDKLPVIKHDKKSSIAHDICIIGYDDDPGSKYNGRFLIKNNYSIWGDERNMAWVKYEDMMYMITHALYFTIE